MEGKYVLKKMPVKRAGSLGEAEQPHNVAAEKFEPLPIGWFTRDGEGDFCGEESNFLKFLYLPSDIGNVSFDLTESNDQDVFNLPIKISEHINPMLHWVKENSPERPSADFVCYRNALATLLKVPYERNEHLLLCAVKLRGTIYLCEFASAWRKEDDRRVVNDTASLSNTKQGLKFQHFMLSDLPGEAPDTSQPFIRDKQETCVVFEAESGPHSLLYASKNKGVPDAEAVLHLEHASLIDVKTYRTNNYRWFKLLDWWSSGVTGKVDRLFVGLRGDYGLVREIEVFDIPTLLRKAHEEYTANAAGQRRQGGGRGRGGRTRGGGFGSRGRTSSYSRGFSAPTARSSSSSSSVAKGSEAALHNRCFGFLNEFLSYVKSTMQDDEGPDVVFQFSWSPECEGFVEAKKLTGAASVPYRFVPDWYVEWLDKLE